MKRYISIIFFLIFNLISAVGFSNPLSGIYTIGGASPDYATFTLAANALNANGVSGPVTFNVRPGIYNEQISISTISGASRTNKITFQSESGVAADVTITFDASSMTDNYVIDLNGASYVTFKYLTITATDTTYAKDFFIKNGAGHDSIVNDILNCPLVNWDDYNSMVIDASPNGTDNDSIVVINNQINGGSFGYETEGYGNGEAKGLVIANNVWTNQTYMAVDIGNVDNAIIQSNIMVATVAGARFGIIVWNGCDHVQILDNKIYGVQSQGLYIPSAGVAGREGLIANNFISVSGIGIEGINTTNQFFYHNSIEAGSYLVYMLGGCYKNVFKNNIFYSTTGNSFMSVSPDTAISESDYNDFYTTGSFGDWNGTPCSNLASWVAASGKDVNSRFLLPAFTSSSDLHLTNFAGMNFGIPLSAVPTDIDGDIRSLTNPVVGADEGSSPAKVKFAADNTAVCEGGTISFTDQSTNSPTGWQWTFNGGTPGSSGSQNPTVTYNTAGTYDVKLVVTSLSGKDSLTKTGYITVNPAPVAGSVTGNPDSICAGNSSQITATGSKGTIQWQSSTDGIIYTDIAASTSAVYNASNLNQSTYYRVKANNSCGIDSSFGKKIVVVAAPVSGTIVSLSDTICSGTVAHLSASGNSGSIQWQSSGNISGTFSNITGGTSSEYATILSKTTYYRIVADNGICGDTSIVFTQHVAASPLAVFADSVDGQKVSFSSAGSSGASSYYWNFGDSTSSTDVNPVHTYSAPGNFHVCLTVSNSTNCNFTFCNNVEAVPTGVNNISLNEELNIYPNPFSDNIFIDCGHTPVNGIEIYDVTGREVMSEVFNASAAVPINIDAHSLSAGMYYVRIKANTYNYFNKIIKQ